MNDDQLSLLSKTIATHAREVAGKEWKDEHRPVLISILTHAGLGNLDEGMLTLQDKEVPIKSIVTAFRAAGGGPALHPLQCGEPPRDGRTRVAKG